MPCARDASRKKWDKMIQKEQEEHPSFTPEQIRQIVQDHFQSRHSGRRELAFVAKDSLTQGRFATKKEADEFERWTAAMQRQMNR